MPDTIAYLVSQYPAISHTFVEREILALREFGVRVLTFSVRPFDPESPFSSTSRAEAAATRVIQGRPARVYLATAVAVLLRNPRGVAAGLAVAATAGPGGAKKRLWQFFYLLEALYLHRAMRRAGVRRLHVHHANNAADIARIAVAIGNGSRRRGGGWSWTLGLHGPTEFLDAAGHDLPAKLRSASAIACISDYARRLATTLAPEVEHARLAIVRMSAPADRFAPGAAVRLARRGNRPLHVLFVGRLVPEKAPDVLVAAVRHLLDDGIAVRASIAGDGPLRGDLADLIRAQGLEPAVELLGPVGQTELPRLYAEADVFCLPSYAEGIPVVLMEAMLTELPVVTTRIAGIPELVDPTCGVLVEPGDVAALATAIRRLSVDPAGRQAMGRAGRIRVLADFGAHDNAERLRELVFGR